MFEWLKTVFVTISGRGSEISQTRDISGQNIRDIHSEKPVVDSLNCPYCGSTTVVKKGVRRKKMETIQLYRCQSCMRVFTPQITKGKHYPLSVMLDALAIYHLGYSLEQTCRIVNQRHQKTASFEAAYGDSGLAGRMVPSSQPTLSDIFSLVKRSGLPDQPGPTPHALSPMTLQPSTLAHWLTEYADVLPFSRMREFAIKRYPPKDMIVTATLAHRQLYRYRFHRAKAELTIHEEWGHRKFTPLGEFLAMVPGECPHQYFQEGLRASEAPLTFSKTAMIVRGKTNYATRMAAFVLQSVKERKERHEAIQKFFLACDSVTVASEVPVYLTRDDLEHMKSQLGFELFGDMPKLITGHIDLLQIRNGQIHILDYKPNAGHQRPIEQLTLYAMALSRLTGLRLFEFKCAWFDEKEYFEFYPLHVLHKPKRARRRRKVETKEGVYEVNKNREKIERIRPL